VLPAKAIRHGWSQYTRAVLGAINGTLEQTARRAMAGQAIKNSPLIESHIIGLTDKAIQEAAHGLKGTENQVALGRAVDRMYGKYQKFSPERRSLLLHWTPFLPWYLNCATFLLKVLPVDHPVQTALLADINAAEEDWRKHHHLSLLQGNHVPDFLLGSTPPARTSTCGSRTTPRSASAPTRPGAVGSLALPQITGRSSTRSASTGRATPSRSAVRTARSSTRAEGLRALVTAAEEQVPGVTQAGAISGVTPRYVDKQHAELHQEAQPGAEGLPADDTDEGRSRPRQRHSAAPAAGPAARAARSRPSGSSRSGRRAADASRLSA
jgi:hypothetical protein